MTRKLEWNPEHKDADDQEMAWRMEFLSWPVHKKWNYLMKLCKSQNKNLNPLSKRRIEWI